MMPGSFARRALVGCLAPRLACGPEAATSASTTGAGETSTSTLPTTGVASSTGTTGGGALECVDATPLAQRSGAPSGFEVCDDGAVHRVMPVECTLPMTPGSCTDNSNGGECSVDSECIAAPLGTCEQDPSPFEQGECKCVYGCRSDADCEAGRICRCAGPFLGLFTECVRADCASDADCDGGLCLLSPTACEPGGRLLACLHADDTCFDPTNCHDYCVAFGDSWACDPLLCG